MEMTFQSAVRQELEGNTQYLLTQMSLLETVCADVNASLLRSRMDLHPDTQQAVRARSAYKLGAASIENWVDLEWGSMETVLKSPTNELVERYMSIYGKPVKVR